jgi:hypothetical protein
LRRAHRSFWRLVVFNTLLLLWFAFFLPLLAHSWQLGFFLFEALRSKD